MTDAPAFFRAIEANPDDDTPRLVYADWLDENAASDADRARAELIRVQCEREREPPGERNVALAGREGGLLVLYGKAWAEQLPGLRLSDAAALTGFRRGFLDPLTLPGANFAPHASRLSELEPLFHVRLVRARDQMPAVAACPQLAFVRRFSLSGAWVRNAETTALAASPHLANLECLDLSENQISDRGATDFATAQVPALRELRLERNPLKDRGLLALVQADWPSLEHLDASDCGLRSAAGLADAPLVRRLVSLRLSRNPEVPPTAWARLAAAPFAKLERLDLSSPLVTDEVAEALAANPALATLRVLHLGATTIADRGARAILASPYLRGLTRLRLPEAGVTTSVIGRLRAVYGAGFNPQS